MLTYKYVHPKVNDFYHRELQLLVYHHLTKTITQRYFDGFRGSVALAYNQGLLTLEGLIFFNNFVAWLEDSSSISDECESRWYETVFNDYAAIMYNNDDI